MLEEKIDELIVEQKATNALLTQVLSGGTVEASPEKEKKESAAAKKKRIAAEKKAKEEAEIEDDDFGLGDEEAPVESTEPQMTRDDAEDELRKLVKNGHGKEARAILNKYEAKRMSNLKDEQINDFYNEVKALNDGQ